MLVSGPVWLATGIIADRFGDRFAFTALFVGGMAIWPLSLLIALSIFMAPKMSLANPLDRPGLETTFMLFGGILVAYVRLRVAPVGSASLLVLAVAPVRVALVVGAIEIGFSAILIVRWKRLTVQA